MRGPIRILVGRRFRWGAVGAVGALALAGGVAYATIPDSGGVIHTCFGKGSGTWRPIDYPTKQCKSGETQLDLYSKSGADAAFLGKTAKAADSDKLDGIDSTGFIQGQGLDYRKVTTFTNDTGPDQLQTPFGVVELSCGFTAKYFFRRFANAGGGQTVRVFDQQDGGAPAYYTIDIGFNGAVHNTTAPQRATWEMTDNDGNNSLEVDVWARFISTNNCQFITHWSYGPNPS
jgi:hypothetical protein